MRKIFALLCLGALAVSCKKAAETQTQGAVSSEVLQQVAALGFSTDGVSKVDGGYLVEGDILLTPENLKGLSTTKDLIASEEHYRTTNLVIGTRNITVSVNASADALAYFGPATDEAIRRYNAQGLRLTFSRVASGGDIAINTYYERSNTLGSAGFPTASGNPYNEIRMNTYWYNSTTNVNYLASIIAHEVGHCIGYRHTDYMNRQYSCGGRRYNEGSAGVGAIHIPGTPTTAEANSWMLACSDGSNRPFTINDQTALRNVYPK